MGRRWFTVGLALLTGALGGACGKEGQKAAETAAPAVTTPQGGEANFSVSIQAEKVKAGQPGNAEIVLEPKGAFHCNENYPYRFKLAEPPAGVSYPSPVVGKDAMTI